MNTILWELICMNERIWDVHFTNEYGFTLEYLFASQLRKQKNALEIWDSFLINWNHNKLYRTHKTNSLKIEYVYLHFNQYSAYNSIACQSFDKSILFSKLGSSIWSPYSSCKEKFWGWHYCTTWNQGTIFR